ncbi:UNVERIFIED_CONTAM: glutamate--cysteine ligase, partial [Bifidobacterium breve]|nr:glutamate--cysteine ligase [Bifidobacterium breve]
MMDRCAAMREAMHEPELRAKLFAGSFGMRMQAHRVLTDGRASRYPYPSQLG